MLRSYGITNTSFRTETPHFWCVYSIMTRRVPPAHRPSCTQVEGTLYCIHRYFFFRDSAYFPTQFSQFDIHDHEASHTIISLGDIERQDFDAFLSILYPEYGWQSIVYEFTYQGVSIPDISGRLTSLTKSGNPCFTSQHAGGSLRFAGWH